MNAKKSHPLLAKLLTQSQSDALKTNQTGFPQPLFNQALEKIKIGHYGEARLLLLGILKDHPQHLECLAQIITISLLLNEDDTAFHALAQATTLAPKHPLVLRSQVRCLLHQKQIQSAYALALTCIENDAAHPETHELLGYCALAMKNKAVALTHLNRALEFMPDLLHARAQRAGINFDFSNFQEAIHDAERVLKIFPNWQGIRLILSNSYKNTNQFNAALSCIQDGLVLNPNDFSLLNLKGEVCIHAQLFQDALLCLNQAISLNQNNAACWTNYALMLHHFDKKDAAKNAYSKAINLHSENELAHFHLALIAIDELKFKNALVHIQNALNLQPNNLTYLCKNALILFHLPNLKIEFAAYLNDLLEMAPAHPDLHFLLAKLKYREQAFQEALTAIQRAQTLSPQDLEIRCFHVFILYRAKNYQDSQIQLEELLKLTEHDVHAFSILHNQALEIAHQSCPELAEKLLRFVIQWRPDFEEAKMNLGYLLLSQGAFSEAWTLHESRYHPLNKHRCTELPNIHFPMWQGETLQGKSIVVLHEQGLGDQIQFVRYVRMLFNLGAAQVSLRCGKSIASIFQNLPQQGIQIFTPAEKLTDHDYWVFLMSLPLHFQTCKNTIPAPENSLFINTNLAQNFSVQLQHIKKLKIGLCWTGSEEYKYNFLRKFNVSDFKKIPELKDTCLFNLQLQQRDYFLSELPDCSYDIGHEIDTNTEPFVETIALMLNLELIICCDTSIAHLAGSLGKKVFLLLSHQADWRWHQDINYSPWYPSMRVFRPTQENDWHSVFEQVSSALKELITH